MSEGPRSRNSSGMAQVFCDAGEFMQSRNPSDGVTIGHYDELMSPLPERGVSCKVAFRENGRRSLVSQSI